MSSPGYISTYITAPGITTSAEQSLASAVTGGSSTQYSATSNRMYVYLTLPTTYPFVKITAVQWKNGISASGNIVAGVDILDANPAVSANTLTVAITSVVAQGGSGSTQKANTIWSELIPGGTAIGMWVESLGAASMTFSILTAQPSINIFKAVTTNNFPVNDTTAWSASTGYLADTVLYYKGFS